MELRAISLLRDNPGYARLWGALAVSLLGDWFTLLALAILVSDQGHGSGLAVSGILVTQYLPTILVGPWSGVLVDRFDRRMVLVAADVLRLLVALGFVAAATSGSLPLIYGLSLLHFTIATVFEPARGALLPRLVPMTDIVRASTLDAVTWSAMMASGGLLAGSVVAILGVQRAFFVDALTFAVSALLIASIRVRAAAPTDLPRVDEHGPRLQDALLHLRAHPATAATLLVKPMASIVSIDLFMVLFGTRVFAHGPGGSLSLGVLYAAFGVGAVLGPVLLNRWNDGSVRCMRRLVRVTTALVTTGMLGLWLAPNLAVAALFVAVRAMGGAGNWMLSAGILQKSVPDELKGRVFALDLAGTCLAATVSSVMVGTLSDRLGVHGALSGVVALSVVPLLFWAAALPRLERQGQDEPPTPRAA